MEQLTKRDINGIAYIELGYNYQFDNMQAIQHLAEYEETGLTPEQINDLAKHNKELQEENERLKEQLDAAIDDIYEIRNYRYPCTICKFDDMIKCCHDAQCGDDTKYFEWRGLEVNND